MQRVATVMAMQMAANPENTRIRTSCRTRRSVALASHHAMLPPHQPGF